MAAVAGNKNAFRQGHAVLTGGKIAPVVQLCKVGEGFVYDSVSLEVLEMDGLRVERVLVKKLDD